MFTIPSPITKFSAAKAVSIFLGAIMCAGVSFGAEISSTPATFETDIAAAADGDVIHLAAGTYPLTQTLLLDKAITVSGAGEGSTTIQGPEKADFLSIYLKHEQAVLEGVTFTGIYFTSQPPAAIDGCHSGGQWKSAVAVRIDSGTFRNSTISGLRQHLRYVKGGALYMSGGVASNVKVLDNYITRPGNTIYGYAVYMEGTSRIENSEIAHNRADNEAEGSLRMTASSTLFNTSVHDNYTTSDHTSAYFSGVWCDHSQATIDSCRVYNNTTGVRLQNGTMKNSLVYNNRLPPSQNGAERYSGVYCNNGKIYNCIIFGNTTAGDDPQTANLFMSSGTVINNIISSGRSTPFSSITVQNGTFNTNLTDFAVSYAKGIGNKVGGITFQDAAAGNFAPTLASAAVGGAAPIAAVTTDLFGTPRSATTPTIGAIECVTPETPTCAFSIQNKSIPENSASSVTAVTFNLTEPITYEWYVDGVLSAETSMAPTFSDLSLGAHTIKLVASDAAASATYEEADAILVKPTRVYVSPAGSNTYPFDSEEKAAHAIPDAIDALYYDDEIQGTVFIANGTYPLADSIALGGNILLEGESRDGVVITGGLLGGKRAFRVNPLAEIRSLTVAGCTNTITGTGLFISGGTINNVRVTKMRQPPCGDPPDGVGLAISSGVVTNCFIDANYMDSNYHGSNGIGIYMTGGLVVDSTICSNKMNRTQHGGLGVYMTGGTVRRCRIFGNDSGSCNAGSYGYNNGCAGHGISLNGSSALLEDSYIYENGKNGLFIYNGTARNCVVYGHTFPGNHCAGVYLSGGRLLNSTIYGNTATQDDQGLSGLYMVGGTAINNIIYGNGNPTLGSARVTKGTFATNLTDIAISGSIDCAVGNPYFVDPENHDFHLQGKMSLAVDSACPLAEITHDIEGLERPQGNGFDMGAFEYLPGTEKTVSATTTSGATIKCGATYSANAETENIDVESATFTWSLTREETLVLTETGVGATFATFSQEITENGSYILSLSVTPDGEEAIPSANELTFEVKPIKVYVSCTGSATYPFDTPETATASLTDAYNAVFRSIDDLSTIEIAEGTYSLSTALSLNTPIAIIGAGSDRVTLNGSALAQTDRAFSVITDNSLLQGFTIEGCTNNVDTTGYCIRLERGMLNDLVIQNNTLIVGAYGSGGALNISGGTVSNCVIRGNKIQADSHTTSGAGIYMTGGLITDSVICKNFLKKDECWGVGFYFAGGTARRLDIYENRAGGNDSRDNAYGGGVYMSGSALLEYSRIHNNYNGIVVDGGTLKNCLIDNNTWNRSLFAGLRQQNGTVINCTIADNICEGNDANSDLVKTGGTIKNSIALKANVSGGSGNNNLFNDDPIFKRNYRLSRVSPAIDAGDNSANVGEVDLAGKPRIHPLRNIIDLGCFESAPPNATMLILK